MALLNSVDPLLLATLGLSTTLTGVIYWSSRKRDNSLLPGPKGHWFWGYDIPKTLAHRHFETLAQEYGPVFSLTPKLPFYNPPIVVINRVDAANYILEKNGASTMDRPRSITAGEILSGGMRVIFTGPGDRFKTLRKALHSHLQPRSVLQYIPVQERYAKKLVLDMMHDPDSHQAHATLFSASLVISLSYGLYEPRKKDDPIVLAVVRCLRRLAANLQPGLWLVDAFPVLRYLPGYPLEELKSGHEEELTLFRTQLDHVRKREADPDSPPPPPCFGAYCLEHQQALGLSDNEIAYLAGSMFGAGSDTTASAISIIVLASLLYPHFQEALHKEIDNLSQDRTIPPTCAQVDSLELMPRLHAFVWETFRWRPIAPGGLSHKSTKDVVWEGKVIPAGSDLICNIWAMGRDTQYFPDPETFNPSRWLQADGDRFGLDNGDLFCSMQPVKLRNDLKSKALFQFGFGRRACPGQWMASRSALLTCALMHWAFNFLPHPDQPVVDPNAFINSATAHPLPFKVKLVDRLGGGATKLEERLEGYGEQ